LLKEKGFEFIEPLACTEEDILLMHSKDLLEKVKNLDFFEPDTPALPDIFNYASLSAGAAIQAMELSLREKRPYFSLMRPPGHHAGKDKLGGFCYFNNIAVSVKKALLQNKRVAILDIDVHHGNGTEEIFRGKANVLYVSMHQVPLYPGTGLESSGNCLNYPLIPGTEEGIYITVFREALVKIKDFSPDLIAISAGFDTYKADPLANIKLEIQTYQKINQLINTLNIPYFCVLEGGYSEELKDCVLAFVSGL
jgi:acetoin utilization deacetylase AcuC-like enzyme